MRKQLIIATAMIFLVIAICGAASAAEGDTTKITPTTSNGASFDPSISDDGNWITYSSDADNLVPGDTPDAYRDVFVYNRQSGEITKLTPSVSNGDSETPDISADGNWITYHSYASNIVPGDTADIYSDIFLFNRLTGETTKVTPLASNENSYNPRISGDGNWIVYQSLASNIVPGDTADTYRDIFLFNRLTGETTKVTPLVSNEDSYNPRISSDNNWITYQSIASNIIPGDTADTIEDIFLYNRLTGETTKITPLASNGGSGSPSISSDGTWITYSSSASNIVPGDTDDFVNDVFLYNRLTSESIKVTPLVSNGDSMYSIISANGNWIVYESLASNIVPGDTADFLYDVFLYNRLTDETIKVTPLASNGNTHYPSISADGNWIVYESRATNIVPGDTVDFYEDIFLYDNPSVVPSISPEPVTPSEPITPSGNVIPSGNEVNAVTITEGTVGMQKTGMPIAGLILAIFAVFGGLLARKRK